MCDKATESVIDRRPALRLAGRGLRSELDRAFPLTSIQPLGAAKAARGGCSCGHACPRKYLAWTGFVLAAFLAAHLCANLLAFWPDRYQTMVNRNHSMGAALAILEIGLIFVPLAVHAGFGIRTLAREGLKFGIKKHHNGSDVRHWLQRVSAAILLAFLLFHVGTAHRWFGGRFDAGDAFGSVSKAVWGFWSGRPGSSLLDLLTAQFFLLGIFAAVYHAANGVATGAEVLGFADSTARQERLWKICLAAASFLMVVGLAAWLAAGISR